MLLRYQKKSLCQGPRNTPGLFFNSPSKSCLPVSSLPFSPSKMLWFTTSQVAFIHWTWQDQSNTEILLPYFGTSGCTGVASGSTGRRSDEALPNSSISTTNQLRIQISQALTFVKVCSSSEGSARKHTHIYKNTFQENSSKPVFSFITWLK